MSAAVREPRAADGEHVGLIEPGADPVLGDAAGRAELCLRERPGQRLQRRDPAGRLGREEFRDRKPRSAAAMYSDAVWMPGTKGRVRPLRRVEQRRAGAGAEGETQAQPLRQVEIVAVSAPCRSPTTASGTSAAMARAASRPRLGAQRHLQHPHAAGDQRPGQRHGMRGVLDGEHGNEPCSAHQRGNVGHGGLRDLPSETCHSRMHGAI